MITQLDISPHLLVMTNSELENRLNVNLDTLLSSGQMHVPNDLRQTRIESYQALALLSGRLANAEGKGMLL